MAAFSQAVFVILVLLVEAQENRQASVVKEGEDLFLYIYQVPEDYSVIEWQFNNTAYLVRSSPGEEPEVSPEYSGRIEFTGDGFSVKLKNLQLADSGVYTARVLLPVGFQQRVEYDVTVEGESTFRLRC
ncbi:hypothetical protein EYF80_063318 [Liparis tanakae]|uniref:Immunoglobulin V-set domain-containing protein n=1 Tax=Liparis tanakae TaxID=230148 RepID=A0A4Z2ECG3_9TELE|nr:hypothetical protein EYF80_063318 [Liparis tanakae]